MTKERIFQHFKPYPGYRTSGFPWLGSVPAEWKPKRLRFACAVNPSTKTDLPPDALVTFAPMETVGQLGGMDAEEKELDSIGSGYTAFKNNDVLIAKITPCFENGKGALAKELSNGIGFGSTEFHILRHDKETSPRYLFYLSISDFFRKIGAAFMTGAAGQKRVPTDFIKNFPFPCPPFVQQEKIADFLDEQCERIDSIITRKRRILELLDEKRNAIITNAVTKGIKQDVVLKDSGIEWLGEIPNHWKVKKARYCFSILLGKMLQSKSENENDCLVFYYRALNVQWGIITGDIKEMWATNQEKEIFSIQRGDLLTCEGGEVGRSALVEDMQYDNIIIQNSLHRVRSKNGNVLKFLYYILCHISHMQWFDVLCNKATIAHFTSEKYKSLEIPLPPVEEQKVIIDYLDEKCAKIDVQKSAHQRSIDLLLEYRASLITQAVTGKIDVRNWQQCA